MKNHLLGREEISPVIFFLLLDSFNAREISTGSHGIMITNFTHTYTNMYLLDVTQLLIVNIGTIGSLFPLLKK